MEQQTISVAKVGDSFLLISYKSFDNHLLTLFFTLFSNFVGWNGVQTEYAVQHNCCY